MKDYVPLTDAELESLLYHACSSGTPTPPMVRDAVTKACLELADLRSEIATLRKDNEAMRVKIDNWKSLQRPVGA